MQITRVLIAMMSVALAAPLAQAQSVSAKGMATVTFSGSFSAAAKQDALQKAEINALDRYFSDAPPAKQKNFEAIRSELVGSLDGYLLGATILSEERDDKGHSYTVVIRADINSPKLENRLQASSAMATSAAAEKSSFTFVFVARQQKSVQTFDAKVYKRTDTQTNATQATNLQKQNTETEKIDSTNVATNDAAAASSDAARTGSVALTTGGSATQRAAVVEWEVTRAADINSIITGTFSAAGYEVVEAEYVDQLNVDAIRADYSHGDDLSPATLRATVAGVKTADIPFLALGTLDVGLMDLDPVTGNVRVYVTVIGKVLNVSGRFPKTVSSVGPVQFAGLGPNETVARTNALKLAAQNAAQQLLNELNAKSVQ